MSWVANVMLSVSRDDMDRAKGFAEWIRGKGWGDLVLVTGQDTQWGGFKFPECNVLAGALNHAGVQSLVERFASTPWRNANAVQLLVMDQEESFFRLWMIREGRVQQYAPTSPDEEDDEFWP
jgi:hypothetical protein